MWFSLDFGQISSVETVGAVLLLLISIFGLYTSYYVFFVVKKPNIYVNNDKISAFLQQHVKILNQRYWPSFFYWEGRAQTILSLRKRMPNSEKLAYRREILTLKDGGELALDFIGEEFLYGSANEPLNNNGSHKLIVVVFPGLTSSSQTCYVKTLVKTALKVGATVVVFNNRGIGGVPLKTPRTHNACNTEDIHEVITYLRKSFPNQRIMPIGTSMGGILLCRYLITYPEEAKNTFVSAMVISTVWDMWSGIENLEIPYINKYVINYGICQDVIYRVKKFQSVLEQRKDLWNFDQVYASKSGIEFDTRFHVPQFGYASIEDYYNNCLIVNHTHKFSIPVFGLNSFDDPMQPGKKLPIKEIYTTIPESNLALIVTSHGGHLGFLEGFSTKPKPYHYVEKLTEQLVRAVKYHGDELTKGC